MGTASCQIRQSCWGVVKSKESLIWAEWSPDSFLFHGETGETHLLSNLPAFILQTLQAGSKTTSEIRRETAAACDTDDDDAWQRKILSILANLEELELVERQTSADV
ncbi:hypothetical protein CKO31_22765 [Thiohalocapsa halophila]|uniref:HPr-rel-A system PqqD family peptide chaperone n=1 Tax=Thiohalocapsa halophila TaxID=69359 RepID=A0ABS1CNV7_9GAMM|nr:HPr-rel-A system PqqD family peptide chaperone [Thiohalocapsa halophila]MBK1633515.1 hypothetical protein [Thiohalocapsa halophila]